MARKRCFLERKIDKYNHILELVRTVANILGLFGTSLILLRVFGVI